MLTAPARPAHFLRLWFRFSTSTLTIVFRLVFFKLLYVGCCPFAELVPLSRLAKQPVFFLDRSLGKFKVAAALRNAGASVEVHDDHFPQDALDEQWLKLTGESGWVVLTKDKNIRFHAREKEALTAYNVRAFVLSAKALNADEMAQAFVRALPKIARAPKDSQGGFVATVTQAGAVNRGLAPYPKKFCTHARNGASR